MGSKINYVSGTSPTEVFTGDNKSIALKIKSYKIENFKAFHDSGEIELSPLVLFYGSNSAGKTAIHQPLILLKAAREQDKKSTNENKSLLELEGSNCSISDIKNQAYSDQDTSFVFGFEIISDESEVINYQEDIVYELVFSGQDNLVESGYIYVGDIKYSLLDYFEFDNVFFLKEKKTYIPEEILLYANSVTDTLRMFIDKFAYMGPVRSETKREFVFSGKAPESLGKNGEHAYERLFSLISDNRIDNEDINKWISEFGFELLWKAHGKNTGEIVLKDINTGIETNIVDNGFGIGQSLPVIVQMATMKNGILLSDSPDAFLQSGMQSELAEYVVNCVNNGNKLIIETGSEPFLYRIRRKIAQNDIARDDVRLYYIDSEKAGNSACIKIEISKNGSLSRQSDSFNRFFSGTFNDLSIMKTRSNG